MGSQRSFQALYVAFEFVIISLILEAINYLKPNMDKRMVRPCSYTAELREIVEIGMSTRASKTLASMLWT